jgi:hypothetical protein
METIFGALFNTTSVSWFGDGTMKLESATSVDLGGILGGILINDWGVFERPTGLGNDGGGGILLSESNNDGTWTKLLENIGGEEEIGFGELRFCNNVGFSNLF